MLYRGLLQHLTSLINSLEIGQLRGLTWQLSHYGTGLGNVVASTFRFC